MSIENEEYDEFDEMDDLEEIHLAIVNNELDKLEEICNNGANVNQRFSHAIEPQHHDMTPLALSAALDRINHVRVLLDFGADVNANFANLQTTALMTASFHGHVDIVHLLLKQGANPLAVDLQGSTALGYCFGGSRSIDIVRLLLKSGVDINQRNMLGMNALLLVSGYGNDLLVRMVLEYGANPNSTNDFGHTALHLAIVGKRSLIGAASSGRGTTSLYGLNQHNLDHVLVEWANGHTDLLNNYNINRKDLEKVGQFMMAIGQKLNEPEYVMCSDDQEAMVKRLDAVARLRNEMLQGTKDSKKSGLVDTLLSCGGRRSKQLKADGRNTNSAPHEKPINPKFSASSDVDRDVVAIANRYSGILKFILDAGCDVHKTEHTYGMTALDMALVMGDVESTVMLFAAGGDPDHLLKLFAMTDLYEALARSDKKKLRDLMNSDQHVDINMPFDICNVQPKANDDCLEPGDEGLTSLAVAAKAQDNSTVDIIKLLIKKGADINKIGPAGRSALGEACRWGNRRMIEFLLNQGADLDAPSPGYKNATPIAIAVINKQTETVEYLMSKGAKIDRPMTDGRTSLIHALEEDDMPMVDTLLGYCNLDMNFYDRNGFDFHMADKYKKPNRDIEWILTEIRKQSAQIHIKEEENKHIASKDLQGQPKLAAVVKLKHNKNPDLLLHSKGEDRGQTHAAQKSSSVPKVKLTAHSKLKKSSMNDSFNSDTEEEDSQISSNMLNQISSKKLAKITTDRSSKAVAGKTRTTSKKASQQTKQVISLSPRAKLPSPKVMISTPQEEEKSESGEEETEEESCEEEADEQESNKEESCEEEPGLQLATTAPLSGVLRNPPMVGTKFSSQKHQQDTSKTKIVETNKKKTVASKRALSPTGITQPIQSIRIVEKDAESNSEEEESEDEEDKHTADEDEQDYDEDEQDDDEEEQDDDEEEEDSDQNEKVVHNIAKVKKHKKPSLNHSTETDI